MHVKTWGGKRHEEKGKQRFRSTQPNCCRAGQVADPHTGTHTDGQSIERPTLWPSGHCRHPHLPIPATPQRYSVSSTAILYYCDRTNVVGCHSASLVVLVACHHRIQFVVSVVCHRAILFHENVANQITTHQHPTTCNNMHMQHRLE